MSPGKIASQAGHAYVDALRAAQKHDPSRVDTYFSEAGGHGIKICLVCGSLEKLECARQMTLDAGLPCALITDLGYTVFDGRPTITALGIGPAWAQEVKPITKKFPLMP